jgi:hypothetical protein
MMALNTWKFGALALLTVGAIASAAPITVSSDPTPSLEPRPDSATEICTDAKVGETLGGDAEGCREYLDACLDQLTTSQRQEWHRAVDACLDDKSQRLYSCYARVPWC